MQESFFLLYFCPIIKKGKNMIEITARMREFFKTEIPFSDKKNNYIGYIEIPINQEIRGLGGDKYDYKDGQHVIEWFGDYSRLVCASELVRRLPCLKVKTC